MGDDPKPALPPVPRVSVREVWQSLAPDLQERIGMMVLAATMAERATQVFVRAGDPRLCFASMSAEISTQQRLDGILEIVFTPASGEIIGVPDVREVHIRSCRICGCTDAFGCQDEKGPCWWIGQDLCSACAT